MFGGYILLLYICYIKIRYTNNQTLLILYLIIMKSHLCKCSNCESIFYDENPKTGAEEVETDSFLEVLPMELLNDEGDSFWGCGNCQTDEFLTDL